MKAGWPTKKLGDLCDFEGGSQPPKSEFIYDVKPGYVRFLQIRDFGSDKNITYIRHSKKNRLCDENDILIGRYGASVGKILTDKAGAYNVALMKTIPNLEVLDPSWFYHFLTSDGFQRPLLNVADRSAQAGFSKDDIYNFPVPVPPLPEQRRIVAILDQAFDCIATAKTTFETNLQNARALFESHLQSVFAPRGEGWVAKSIGEVCTLRSGTTVSAGLEKPTGDLPYLKVADMAHAGNETEIFSSTRYLDKADVGKNSVLPAGTTIFPKRGGSILTNKKRLTAVPICADLNIMGVIPGESILPKFLFLYFLNVDMRQIGSGSSIPQINNYDIEPLAISFPQSAEKQAEIVRKFEAVRAETQRLASLYQRKLAALDDLKKSLLHQAFSGAL